MSDQCCSIPLQVRDGVPSRQTWLQLAVLPKGEAFLFFRLLANLDPDVASAEALKYDSHVDFFLPRLTLSCTKHGIRIGEADTEILMLREPPAANVEPLDALRTE